MWWGSSLHHLQRTPFDGLKTSVRPAQTTYVGEASTELKKYVQTCWEMSCEESTVFMGPCVAVIQISGFGKSRMMLELART
ncbi:hypothetical protein JG688_00007985 [Phytophthora aleatoria]|uniref:Uncharacterized protein n=1 Tax=Phytophthora aleatoria TaxID=2496075 RepID=A0A8J5J8Y7_9STRA|nr:hypothetical protein GQ600_6576 [Phytophthora cactorum]KAG6963791.1 hypothetical protein JG688_00007985 [Phytophthora aleatoria]